MNRNTILITIISVVGLFAFLFAVYALTNRPADTTVYPEAKQVESDDHLKWSSAKKHILVDYSDLQCPACKTYHDFIKKEFEASGSASADVAKNITFIYRHFPLTMIHGNALEAAYAAEAAGNQKKFYEMVDLLFNKQDEWSKSDKARDLFTGYAKSLKLDTTKFAKDLESSEVKARVEKDLSTGQTAGVQGTPSFYLDGKKVTVTSFDEFTTLLEQTAKQ